MRPRTAFVWTLLACAAPLVACGGESPPPAANAPQASVVEEPPAAEAGPPEAPPVADEEPEPAAHAPRSVTTAVGFRADIGEPCIEEPVLFNGDFTRELAATPSPDGTFSVTARFVPHVVGRSAGDEKLYGATAPEPTTAVLKPGEVKKVEVRYPLTYDGAPTRFYLVETVGLTVVADTGEPVAGLEDGTPGFDASRVKVGCGRK